MWEIADLCYVWRLCRILRGHDEANGIWRGPYAFASLFHALLRVHLLSLLLFLLFLFLHQYRRASKVLKFMHTKPLTLNAMRRPSWSYLICENSNINLMASFNMNLLSTDTLVNWRLKGKYYMAPTHNELEKEMIVHMNNLAQFWAQPFLFQPKWKLKSRWQ